MNKIKKESNTFLGAHTHFSLILFNPPLLKNHTREKLGETMQNGHFCKSKFFNTGIFT